MNRTSKTFLGLGSKSLTHRDSMASSLSESLNMPS